MAARADEIPRPLPVEYLAYCFDVILAELDDGAARPVPPKSSAKA